LKYSLPAFNSFVSLYFGLYFYTKHLGAKSSFTSITVALHRYTSIDTVVSYLTIQTWYIEKYYRPTLVFVWTKHGRLMQELRCLTQSLHRNECYNYYYIFTIVYKKILWTWYRYVLKTRNYWSKNNNANQLDI